MNWVRFIRLFVFLIAGGYIIFVWLMKFLTGYFSSNISTWISISVFGFILFLGWRYKIIP